MRFCPKCGAEIQGKFCSECGFNTQKERRLKVPNFLVKACGVLKNHKKSVILGSSVFVALLTLAIVLIIALSNIFRVEKIGKIELGMTAAEVEKILGAPTTTYEDDIWCWYEKKAAKKIAEFEGFGEDLDEDANLEDIENELENADEAFGELEEMSFKCIIVEFDEEEKVSKVIFDTEHKYDMFEPYNVKEKEIKSVETNLGNMVSVTKTITEKKIEDDSTVSETELRISAVEMEYSAKFTDGSYILYTAIPIVNLEEKEVYTNADEYLNPATLRWRDDIADYEKIVDTVVVTFNIFEDEDTTLTKVSISGDCKSIIIPDNITNITREAFKNCEVEEIAIPDSVTYIHSKTFENCENLMYNEYDNAYYLGNKNNPYLVLIKAKDEGIVSCEINHSTKVIAASAFYSCINLKNLLIGTNVTNIGKYAFYECTALEEINYTAVDCIDFKNDDDVFENAGLKGNGIVLNIGANVKRIPSYMFYNGNKNIKIVAVRFEDGSLCETIGEYAFGKCDELTSLTIPEHVNSIGRCAFIYCTALTEISYNATECADLNENTFNSVGQNGEGIKVLIGVNVKRIPAYLFSSDWYMERAAKIATVTFEEGSVCENIGDGAFYYCRYLTSINLPQGLKSIGAGAFVGCRIKTIYIPDSVISIGGGAFSESGVKSVTIGKNVTSIGWYAFDSCGGLESVTFANTEGWFTTTEVSSTSGTSVDVTDASQNVDNLTDVFNECYWKRNED